MAAFTFNIPRQSLVSAMIAFQRVTGISVLADGSVPQKAVSPGVSGAHSADSALQQMLAGTGLSYTISGGTARIFDPSANNAGASVEGAIALDTIDVSGGGTAVGDVPYQTPGSVNAISAEQMARFPGKTAGDIFKGTPGVISGMNPNGAAVDVNIRGLQGMNRVAVTIDGAQQSTSTYRGYAGVDNRSYVDPDLISGVTITKGPDGGAAGAIGGTVAMETLKVDDILKAGDSYGVRIKGSLSSNSIEPQIGSSVLRTDDGLFGAKSGSIAFASSGENVDVVAAYVRRKSGNYFAGTHGDRTYTDARFKREENLSATGYGEEVFNTSEDVTSLLLKSTMRIAEDQKLQLGYMRYENNFGEVTPTIVGAINDSIGRQIPLSGIAVDALTARYGWKPADNDLIDFKGNAWMTNTDEDSFYALYSDAYAIYTQTKDYGLELSNTSRFDVASMPFALSYGGSIQRQDGSEREKAEEGTNLIIPVDGTRQIASAFINGELKPVSWLAIDGGVEYLTYSTHNRTTPVWTYARDGYAPYADYNGDGFSPHVGVTITPLDGWQIFAKYTAGIRPPSLRESTYTSSALVFNPDLKHETAKNWEFGTNILNQDLVLPGDKARLKLAYFDNTTEDYIGRQASSSFVLSLFNYDKVEMKGLELSGGYDAGTFFSDVALNYYTDIDLCPRPGNCVDYALQSDYIANHIPPRFMASATVGGRFLDEKLTLGTRVTYVGDRAGSVVSDAYSNTLGMMTKVWNPYMLVDAFAQYKLNDSVTFDVSAENLLDRYYVDALANTDLPAPGRTIRVGLTAKTGGNEPIPDLWPNFALDGEAADANSTAVRWTGVYAGAHMGHGFGSIEGVTATANGSTQGTPERESADQGLSDLLYGGQIGFNYQTASNWVFGVEGDFAWTRMRDHNELIATESATLADRDQLEARVDYGFDWLATLRGRIGYAFNKLFVYGTGGLAFLKETDSRAQYAATNVTNSQTAYEFTESDSAVHIGGTVGGGAEYAIDGHWSLKADYLYAGFGAENFLFPDARAGALFGGTNTITCRPTSPPPCPGGTSTTIRETYEDTSGIVTGRKASNDVDLHTLRLGINYRF